MDLLLKSALSAIKRNCSYFNIELSKQNPIYFFNFYLLYSLIYTNKFLNWIEFIFFHINISFMIV